MAVFDLLEYRANCIGTEPAPAPCMDEALSASRSAQAGSRRFWNSSRPYRARQAARRCRGSWRPGRCGQQDLRSSSGNATRSGGAPSCVEARRVGSRRSPRKRMGIATVDEFVMRAAELPRHFLEGLCDRFKQTSEAAASTSFFSNCRLPISEIPIPVGETSRRRSAVQPARQTASSPIAAAASESRARSLRVDHFEVRRVAPPRRPLYVDAQHFLRLLRRQPDALPGALPCSDSVLSHPDLQPDADELDLRYRVGFATAPVLCVVHHRRSIRRPRT